MTAKSDEPGTTRLTIRNLTQLEHIAIRIMAKEQKKTKEEWVRDLIRDAISDTVARLEDALHT